MTVEQVEALRAGDEQAFRELVATHQGMLLRLARVYAPSQAVAEECVQETWLAVIRGLRGFDGRASLRTWICRILVNVARRQAGREARTVPFSALSTGHGPTVDPDRFYASGPYEGHWLAFPDNWSRLPEHQVIGDETQRVARDAIDELALPQRVVITLRDLEGWTADEVCAVLDITDGHQRVLLHRARGRVREALASYLATENLVSEL